MIERWRSFLAEPVDGAWLASLRTLFGLIMAVSMARFIAYDWIDTFFVTPRFHFTYWGFGWIEPLSRPLMHALFYVLLGLALCTACGVFARVALALFVLGFSYLSLIDVTTYLNHYYLAILLGWLLVASPAHRVGLRGAPGSFRAVPRFWHLLFRAQMATVYTYAGFAKLQADWLVHAQPLRIWLGSHTDMPLLGPVFAWELAPALMSWAGFLFDSTVAWFLLWQRTRPYAYVAVLVFHALTRLLFPIGMFPAIMVVGATVFFSPSWPRRLLGRFARSDGAVAPAPSGLGLALAAIFLLVQLTVPLRFLAYGGDVRWHEQGMRWSWRVMVREKNGSVTFRVRKRGSAHDWEVSPSRYLTRLQEREMASQPDLILQLAHHVRDDFAARGFGPVEVRVDALVSLNGRTMARLIDPNVDLARVSDGIARAHWILAAPSGPPPHLCAI